MKLLKYAQAIRDLPMPGKKRTVEIIDGSPRHSQLPASGCKSCNLAQMGTGPVPGHSYFFPILHQFHNIEFLVREWSTRSENSISVFLDRQNLPMPRIAWVMMNGVRCSDEGINLVEVALAPNLSQELQNTLFSRKCLGHHDFSKRRQTPCQSERRADSGVGLNAWSGFRTARLLFQPTP